MPLKKILEIVNSDGQVVSWLEVACPPGHTIHLAECADPAHVYGKLMGNKEKALAFLQSVGIRREPNDSNS